MSPTTTRPESPHSPIIRDLLFVVQSPIQTKDTSPGSEHIALGSGCNVTPVLELLGALITHSNALKIALQFPILRSSGGDSKRPPSWSLCTAAKLESAAMGREQDVWGSKWLGRERAAVYSSSSNLYMSHHFVEPDRALGQSSNQMRPRQNGSSWFDVV
ncbi:hypothetical protein B0H19DRAFT_1070951 [Mycena capillaripes]|nr:hypothetical protein B0H19DRAFT_1070951 [Mycena capillaripes]